MVSCTVFLKERDLDANIFSRRARGPTLGADSLLGVGLPDPVGHLSAGVSDRRFPIWRGDLGQGYAFHRGVSAAGASAREDESVGVSAVCTHDYSVYSPLYKREYSAARRAAPGQCHDIVWPEFVPDYADTAADASQWLRSGSRQGWIRRVGL